jgi:xylan 1,4-beta-xylosidase
MRINFSGDVLDTGEVFPHFWEHTIGSGHATLALRADWQKQLERCHRELGFAHVRFHGLLSDDMGTLVDEEDELVYSFFNADQICDFLLSIGMRPFIELSFMPFTLSSGPDIVFHYRANVTPPRDYSAWETLIYKLVAHWVERYGAERVREWFFEVWNEPNLSAFWKGTQQEYFLLYGHAAKAIKSVDPKLRVGGPASAANAWITELIQFAQANQIALDFISTHHYPTDAFGKPGDDTISQLAASKRSVLKEQTTQARKDSGRLPLYYTEWSTSSNPFDALHDEPYAAAFILKTIMEARGLVEGYSYWTFSDIFEENYFCSTPFHGGFGLLNIYGIPKPSYRAFELLHRLGTEILRVEGRHPTVDLWIVRKQGTLQILITNSALPRHPVAAELVRVKLARGVGIKKAYVERIDETHANAPKAWQEMGKPDHLTPDQVLYLEATSALVKEVLFFTFENDSVILDVDIPPQGTAFITLETDETTKK